MFWNITSDRRIVRSVLITCLASLFLSPLAAEPGIHETMPWTPPQSLSGGLSADRVWLINTRHLSTKTCCIDLNSPRLQVSRVDACGRRSPSSLDEYFATMQSDRPRLIYIHGNQRSDSFAVERGLVIYRELDKHCQSHRPIDWVIWSWPSEKESLPIIDAKIKAERCDSQALYLAWLLHHHVKNNQPTALIGFSFGARISSGALHALAGGGVGGRGLGLEPISGADIDVGFVAPAVHTNWLTSYGQYRLAIQNTNEMTLLYNNRDVILKNYWLIDRVRGSQALGYTGPIRFAPRVDGSPLPVRSRNCSSNVGAAHKEIEYYGSPCNAGRQFSNLIESCLVRN